MTNNAVEVIKAEEPGTIDLQGLSAVISATIEPLARHDADTKNRAIQADLEKHRITIDLADKFSQRSFKLLGLLLLLVAVVLGALLIAGKFDLAVNTLWYVAGAASGFGVGNSNRKP